MTMNHPEKTTDTARSGPGAPHRRRWLVGLWLVVAGVVWLGMFNVLVSRGVKEYLWREAEHELGRGPQVTMPEIMGQTARDAVVSSSFWAVLVGGSGLMTVYYRRRRS